MKNQNKFLIAYPRWINRTLQSLIIKDDSYIFYNIGYHLFKSEQVDLFPKIYLDLNFVESMLKATSSVDLLNDYKRYGEQIIGRVSPFLLPTLPRWYNQTWLRTYLFAKSHFGSQVKLAWQFLIASELWGPWFQYKWCFDALMFQGTKIFRQHFHFLKLYLWAILGMCFGQCLAI